MHIALTILIFTLIEIAVLAIFYVFIVGRVRKRLEKEIVENIENDLNGLVTEFNRTAINNTNLLEDGITRMKALLAEAERSGGKAQATRNTTTRTTKQTPRDTPAQKISVKKRATKQTPVPDDLITEMPKEDIRNYPKERVKTIYSRIAHESKQSEGGIRVTLSGEGVREEPQDVTERIIELFENKTSIQEIALRMNLSENEVETVLGFAGKV